MRQRELKTKIARSGRQKTGVYIRQIVRHWKSLRDKTRAKIECVRLCERSNGRKKRGVIIGVNQKGRVEMVKMFRGEWRMYNNKKRGVG